MAHGVLTKMLGKVARGVDDAPLAYPPKGVVRQPVTSPLSPAGMPPNTVGGGSPFNMGTGAVKPVTFGEMKPPSFGGTKSTPKGPTGTRGFKDARAGEATAADGAYRPFGRQQTPPTGGQPSVATGPVRRPNIGPPVTGAASRGINLNPAAMKAVSGLPRWARLLSAAGPAYIGAEYLGNKASAPVGKALGLPEWVYSNDPNVLQARADEKSGVESNPNLVSSELYDNIGTGVEERGFFQDPSSSTGWSFSNGNGLVARGVQEPGYQNRVIQNEGAVQNKGNMGPEGYDPRISAMSGYEDQQQFVQPQQTRAIPMPSTTAPGQTVVGLLPSVSAPVDRRVAGPVSNYYDPNL